MNNFVTKHLKRCGSGRHKAKYGKHISRTRSKQLALMEA